MTATVKTQSLYSTLLEEVRNEGLLEKKPMFYVRLFALITVASLLVWGALTFTGVVSSGPAQLIAIPLMVLHGCITAQYGFIGHELAHNQVFRSHRLNTAVGLVVANLFAGLSYGFWLAKHNRHHGKPNMIDSDPDINLRVIAFSTEQKYSKPRTERFLTRHQGWLFPFLLFLTAFDLLLDSIKSVSRSTGRGSNRRWLEASMLIVRFATPIIVLFLLFEPIYAIIAWFAYMFSFGFFMGAAFAVNHIGMPLVAKNSRIGFLERQVLTSRNVTPSPAKDTLMGGLNYQIEHHLFPSMARPNLARARELTKAFCARNAIPYKEQDLHVGFVEVIRYMDKVGVSTKVDPFLCPIVAQYRSGAVIG